MGDRLVVAVTKDESVNKGPGRPIFTQYERAHLLRGIRVVDEVFLCNSSLEALMVVRPDIFVKGREYDGKIRKEDEEFCKENRIEIRFTDEVTYSSTKVLNELRSR